MNPEIAAKLDALSAQFSDHDFDEFESRLRLHAAALGWTGDPMQQPAETVLSIAQSVLRDRPKPPTNPINNKRLNHDQLDGCACVVCGDNFRPMVPLGLETSISSEVFRCDRDECAVDPSTVQAWITASERSNLS